jgi:hypothetical protein
MPSLTAPKSERIQTALTGSCLLFYFVMTVRPREKSIWHPPALVWRQQVHRSLA